MANYLGYSSINANKPRTTNANVGNNGGFGTVTKPINAGKKYKLVDTAIVVQDLINALNIKQGQKVGQPQYGTILWNFVFEPNDSTTQDRIKSEVRRIASLDPRINLNYVECYPQDNGVLIEVELAVTPFNQAQVLQLFANINTYQLTLQ
jgi:phage baseplate assembly protein W